MASGPAMAYGSSIFNGQRFFSVTNDAWNPVALGATLSTVPSPIATVPAMSTAATVAGTSPFPAGSTWSLTQGPVLFALGGLIAGMLLLHFIMFR